MSPLALHGGPKTIPDGAIKGWPQITDTDRKFVLDSLNQWNHAYGPNCVAFEKEFAAWNGNKFAITTNSGTAALHMGVAACGCGAGDEVIVTAYSWSSSATCILHANAIPIFVDIDFDTMNMDVNKIEPAITARTKAIVAVHLHGLALDMEAVMRIARKHNLKVIEDACQSHGATFNGKKVGTFGHCAAFSFNQNKSLCSGEGGMFVTDDDEILSKAKMIWSFGETRTPAESRDYHAYALGWMYRNNDLTAAFGRSQLTVLDRNLAAQRQNAATLLEELNGIKGLLLPTVSSGGSGSVPTSASSPSPGTPGEGRGEGTRNSELGTRNFSEHTFYNFTLRISPDSLGWNGPPAPFRDCLMKALQAEGTQVGIWQQFILPSMTVFQAKNAFGRGSPWCLAHPVNYDVKQFPIAQKHTDTHFGMTTPLRHPNTPETAKLLAAAFRKVFDRVDQLDPACPSP